MPAVTTRRVHELIAELTGRPLSVEILDSPRPWGPFDEALMAEYAELFYQHTEVQIMDSSAFTAMFGTHATPLVDALRETISWYAAAVTAPS